MKTSASHFVTGATGFVGSSLVLELLTQTDDTIYCLVRAKDGLRAQDRLVDLLDSLIEAYQLPSNLKEKIRSHCMVVEADLQQSESAADHITTTIDYFWHVAASLNYEERYRAEIFATNIDGTLAAIKLAKQLQVKHFHYFSTAYVAGKKSGDILEIIDQNIENSNAYEESKVEAELLVAEIVGMHHRIFRPSIVIGQSQTFEAINFTGLYGFLRRLVQFKGMMNRVQKDYLSNNRIKMLVEESVPLNLIPVDMVVTQAVKIGLSGAQEHIYHLTNPQVPTVGQTLTTLFDLVGLMPPEFVTSKESFNWIDDQFNDKIDFYNSYLRGEKRFDRSNTDSALGHSDHSSYAVTAVNLKQYCNWYLDKFAGQRKAVPVSR